MKKTLLSILAVIAEQNKDAEKITLVMDNFGTHTQGALNETFKPNRF